MAFRKPPDAESLGTPTEVIGVDRAHLEAALQLAAIYWPAIVCGIALFVLVVAGRERAAMAVAVVMAAVQAWMLGWIG